MPKHIPENNIDIEPLISTRDFLKEALEKADNKFEIAGTIQAFEVCYELAWKTLKKVLNYITELKLLALAKFFVPQLNKN